MVDSGGRVAVHTGMRCIAHAGHAIGEQVSAQANMMERDTVPRAMIAPTRRRAASRSRSGCWPRSTRPRQRAATSAGASPRPWSWSPGARPGARCRTSRSTSAEDHRDPVGELQRLVGLNRAYARASAGDDAAGGDMEAALAEYEAAHRSQPDNRVRLLARTGPGRQRARGGGGADAAAVFDANPGWVEPDALAGSRPVPDDGELIARLTGTRAVSEPAQPPRPPRVPPRRATGGGAARARVTAVRGLRRSRRARVSPPSAPPASRPRASPSAPPAEEPPARVSPPSAPSAEPPARVSPPSGPSAAEEPPARVSPPSGPWRSRPRASSPRPAQQLAVFHDRARIQAGRRRRQRCDLVPPRGARSEGRPRRRRRRPRRRRGARRRSVAARSLRLPAGRPLQGEARRSRRGCEQARRHAGFEVRVPPGTVVEDAESGDRWDLLSPGGARAGRARRQRRARQQAVRDRDQAEPALRRARPPRRGAHARAPPSAQG